MRTKNISHPKSLVIIRTKWYGIIYRCYNEKAPNYNRYGGRGIGMCDEWRNDFNIFYLWSLANGWADGLQIDRIDNDGWYCPDNCRYVSLIENQRNRNNSIVIEYNGEKHALQEWADILGIKYSTLKKRRRTRGEGMPILEELHRKKRKYISKI